MLMAGSRAPIQVCSVAQNCLAEAYLEQLLGRDPRLQTLTLRRRGGCAPFPRKNLVFVIDQCGLEMPLCDCLKQLRARCSDAKFLVLDDHKPNDEIVRTLIMGAHGYVAHSDAPKTLVRAIICVVANQLWVPPEVLSDFLREVNSVLHKGAHARQTTTPRENEILELMRRRLSNREIADRLGISISTVKFHVSNVLSKLCVKNRRELKETSWQNFQDMQLQ